MVKKNMSELIRFDYTPECKTCQFRKELGLLEYCCGFVIDLIRKKRFEEMKEKVYDYIDFNEELGILDYSNLLFTNDDEYTVTVTFQNILREDKKLILRKVREALMDSFYFNHVNFEKNSLTRKEFNQEPVIIQSKIDEYLSRADIV